MGKLILCVIFALVTLKTSFSFNTISKEEIKIALACQKNSRLGFFETEEAWSFEGPKNKSQRDYLKCILEKLDVVRKMTNIKKINIYDI